MILDDRAGATGLGTYRRAADLVQEMVTKVREAWNAFIAAVQDLIIRARHFLNTDSVWSTIVQRFTGDVVDAIDAINELVSSIRPCVDTIRDVLRRAADNALPVVSLLETAIACREDIAARLTGLAAEITERGGPELWRGAARRDYNKGVRDQAAATDEAAAQVLATSRWLGTVGAANTAYVTNVGHLAAELVGHLVTAAVEAGHTTAGTVPDLVGTLQRLSQFVGNAARRTTAWADELQENLTAALAEVHDLTNGTREVPWPAATSLP